MKSNLCTKVNEIVRLSVILRSGPQNRLSKGNGKPVNRFRGVFFFFNRPDLFRTRTTRLRSGRRLLARLPRQRFVRMNYLYASDIYA